MSDTPDPMADAIMRKQLAALKRREYREAPQRFTSKFTPGHHVIVNGCGLVNAVCQVMDPYALPAGWTLVRGPVSSREVLVVPVGTLNGIYVPEWFCTNRKL